MHRFALLFALVATGCIDTTQPYDMTVEWHTPNAIVDADVKAKITVDGAAMLAGSYDGTVQVTGDATTSTIKICVQAQKLETVGQSSCNDDLGSCDPWTGYVPVTAPLCQTVAVDATHVSFVLAPE